MATSKTLASVPTTTDMTGKKTLLADAAGTLFCASPQSLLDSISGNGGTIKPVRLPGASELGVPPSVFAAYYTAAFRWLAANFSPDGNTVFVCTATPGNREVLIAGFYPLSTSPLDAEGNPEYAMGLAIGCFGIRHIRFSNHVFSIVDK